jgi:hypothetical protein
MEGVRYVDAMVFFYLIKGAILKIKSMAIIIQKVEPKINLNRRESEDPDQEAKGEAIREKIEEVDLIPMKG